MTIGVQTFTYSAANPPKEIVTSNDGHRYGRWFLGWVDYEWRRLRWWESDKGGSYASNFLGDDGNAHHPRWWTELPPSPLLKMDSVAVHPDDRIQKASGYE